MSKMPVFLKMVPKPNIFQSIFTLSFFCGGGEMRGRVEGQ